MLGKMVSYGFSLYTMPARMAYRELARRFDLPDDFEQMRLSLRLQSEAAVREVHEALDSVDREMREKSAHLSPGQRRQAADLALVSAEQHLGMAARNILRALWLATSSNKLIERNELE